MTTHALPNYTARELPADFDVFTFKASDYMESSGLNAAINEAFSTLSNEIAAEIAKLKEHMGAVFAAWEAELV